MMQHAIEAMEKVLSSEHPDMLQSVSYLATALERQGKYEEVEKKHRWILAKREQVLGP
jgi:cytochrome c-type biogenesis protein CcmH/NrfG